MPDRKPEWFDRSFSYVLAVYAAVLVTFFGATLLLSRLLPVPLERGFLMVFGAFTVAGAYWKPWWYWEHIDGWLVRWSIGDRAARIVFFVFGLVMLCLGVFVEVGGIR